MELERSGARIGTDRGPAGSTVRHAAPSVGEAAERIQEAGERLLAKRLDLLRLEAAQLARAGGLGILGSYIAAIGVLLLSSGAVVWIQSFWPLELAFLAVGGSQIAVGLIFLAVAVRRASGEGTG